MPTRVPESHAALNRIHVAHERSFGDAAGVNRE